MKRIAVVGGGYAGIAIARALDAFSEVVLVEPRDAFVHNVGAIRAIVEPAVIGRLIVPYDRLLQKGTVRQGFVRSVAEGGVSLSDGDHIEADAIVMATGSRYTGPFKAGGSVDEFRRANNSAREMLQAVQRIAIVGAGPVGIELAGEILSARRDTSVTLITGSSTLLPVYKPSFGRKLGDTLRAKGARLNLGMRVGNLQNADGPFLGPLTLERGDILDVELVFPATGASPNNGLMKTLRNAQLNDAGRVIVDAHLRAGDTRSIFAIGDVAATGDPMTIFGIAHQVRWLAASLRAFLDGGSLNDQPPYEAKARPALVVPIGQSDGGSILPFTKNGLVFGRRTTARLKGRHLFIERYRKALGYS